MKSPFLTIVALSACASTSILAQQEAQETEKQPAKEKTTPVDPEKVKQTISYGLGYQNGAQFAANGFNHTDFDTEQYIKGLVTGLAGKELGIETEEYRNAIKALDKLIREREKAIAEKNLTAEALFLEKNGKREGVITTESGLQYEILKEGKGKRYQVPANTINGKDITTQFKVNCVGSVLNGSRFLITDKGAPAIFSLNIIKGPAEALKLMPIGSKWKIYVPSKLGFGQLRQGAIIAPNSTLVYELELLEISSAKLPERPKNPHNFKLPK